MTRGVGRNDPCPCGSGRKFKRCCLARATGVRFTRDDRDRVLGQLADFSLRSELDDERLTAIVAFWSDWVEAHGEEDGRPAMELEESVQAFALWFALDVRLGRGATVLELMLRREMTRLSPGARNYLERMRETHLRLYQIIEVKADEGLRLIDLWTGEPVWVRERAGTSQLVRWDVLAVRLVRRAEGDLGIEGSPYVYPVQSKRALLRALRRAHRDFMATNPSGTAVDFFKRVGMRFHHFWLETIALRPLPTLVTAEGDPPGVAWAIFGVRDRDAVAAALGGHRDLEREDGGGYTWLDDEGETRRVLGRFVLEDDRLVFETQSRERVERGRAVLESVAGEAVQFRLVEYEDPEHALARVAASAEPGASSDDVPLEIQDRLVGELYEQRYRDWPDRPIPALGHRTPRQAAALEPRRFRVVELLQAFENASDRRRLAGRPAYDFGWMWAELGLERPDWPKA